MYWRGTRWPKPPELHTACVNSEVKLYEALPYLSRSLSYLLCKPSWKTKHMQNLASKFDRWICNLEIRSKTKHAVILTHMIWLIMLNKFACDAKLDLNCLKCRRKTPEGWNFTHLIHKTLSTLFVSWVWSSEGSEALIPYNIFFGVNKNAAL